MFEAYDFDYILEEMLSKVSDDFDKREGAVIYDALAPAALQLADFYSNLDMVIEETFADTASYEYLIKRAAERGLTPYEETCAICKMVVTPADTPIAVGDRFNLNDLNYMVTSAINQLTGTYQLKCETAGTAANQQRGSLIPIETENELNNMETATLTEILVPGEDEEDVEAFRERYFNSFGNEAFGGNRTDYVQKVNGMDGVGGCKAFRQWNGDYRPADLIPTEAVDTWFSGQSSGTVGTGVYTWLQSVYTAAKDKLLTVGGTVRVIVINSEYSAPSSTLVGMVQEALDPEQNAGEGDGTAPIGHVVHVSSVCEEAIDVTLEGVEYYSGYSFSNTKTAIEAVIDAYLLELRKNWASSDELVVRKSLLEARLLELRDMIVDLSDVLLNGTAGNIVMDADVVPVRGDVNG